MVIGSCLAHRVAEFVGASEVQPERSGTGPGRMALDGRGQRLVRGHRSMEAAVANTSLARSLGISRGASILVLRSVSYGTDESSRA